MNKTYSELVQMARRFLRGKGLDCPADRCVEILSGLHSIPDELVPWYTVPAANRLLSIYECLDSQPKSEFTLAWREPINDLWAAMHSGQDLAPAFSSVLDLLYYSTPFNHFDGQDGPQDASHDPAAACIYAIESAITPDRKHIDLLFNRTIEYAMYDLTLNDSTFGSDFEQPIQEFLELIHPSYRNAVQWHAEYLECSSEYLGRLPADHHLWLNPI